MRSELVVDVTPRDMTTALLEDGRLVSLQRETRDASYAVGNIYLAKVKKLMPGLNAAFVNVGHSKDAFLHYLDLGSQFNTFSQYIKTVADCKRAYLNQRSEADYRNHLHRPFPGTDTIQRPHLGVTEDQGPCRENKIAPTH